MTIAEWKNQKWSVDKNKVRGIESISISCEAKTTTDSATKQTKCTGRTLEKLNISFSTAHATGGDPQKEQKELEKAAGKSAPFYCGTEQIGDNDFILEAVRMNEATLNNSGDILAAKFELSFIEDAKEQELNGTKSIDGTAKNEKIKITFQGQNIAPKISIKKVYYTQYAENHADILEVHFNDTDKNWDRWDGGKINGEEIKFEYGQIKTGKMFISSCSPDNGVFVLRAMSVPASYNTTHSKSWEQITLEELAKEIAGNHGLKCKTYSTKGIKRNYVIQNNSGDFSFLGDRCKLEGACFLVFNGELVVYDEKTIENEKGGAEVDIDDTRFTTATPCSSKDKSIKEYTIKNGSYKGTATDKNGTETKTEIISKHVSSDAEAQEIAKSYLRNANKSINTIKIDTDLRKDISAGSVIKIESKEKKNWSGPAFVYKLRHNLLDNKTTIWARKPLDY